MTKSKAAVVCAVLAVASAILLAGPSVFPTGTTTYDPALAWNGYTVLSVLGAQAAIVIDMNGNVVKKWDGYNSSAGGPVRILPGGVVVGAAGANAPHQESTELVQRDFDGKELWRFDHNEQIQTKDGKMSWATRQHHDWQRADFPGGYYSPGSTPGIQGSNTLLLTHTDRLQPKVSPAMIEDDRIIEVSWDGKLLWQWVASDHIDEFHFDEDARKAIAAQPAGGRGGDAGGGGDAGRAGKAGGGGKAGRGGKAGPGANAGRSGFDWMHTNAAAYVGPNHWYDEGDKRFAPSNVLISSRNSSFLAIIAHDGSARDGSIVWQLGPDFSVSPELRAIRQIIGQHGSHIIPKGLPGAGNVLVFDNGGASGYGKPSAVALNGQNIYARPTSRVLEIDPVSLKLVWSYTGTNFFATNISGAQRLPNGNTLITEGPDGRLFEVTKDSKIVWEYIYPEFSGTRMSNSVYRGYRLPYGWIPQLTPPKEQAVTPPDAGKFRVP